MTEFNAFLHFLGSQTHTNSHKHTQTHTSLTQPCNIIMHEVNTNIIMRVVDSLAGKQEKADSCSGPFSLSFSLSSEKGRV